MKWKHPMWVENAHKWHSDALGKCSQKMLHFTLSTAMRAYGCINVIMKICLLSQDSNGNAPTICH